MSKLNTSAKDIPLDALQIAEYNPREIKREDIDALKRSIEKFGLRGLITVNANKKREGIIIGGNMTVTALRELEWKSVPAKNVDFVDLSETEEKALSLALNKIAQLRNWNDETLAEMMADLNRNGFDTALTGFNEMEISSLLDSQMHGDPDGDEEGDLEEQKEAITKPKTKLGDVYRLG